LADNQAILTDPTDSTKHLLVMGIHVNGKASFDAEEMYGEWRDKEGYVYKLNYRCKSVDPAFRMLLYPYRDGDPLPKVICNDGKFTITIDEQTNSLHITERVGEISQVSIR
jgi:hypothetical protein